MQKSLVGNTSAGLNLWKVFFVSFSCHLISANSFYLRNNTYIYMMKGTHTISLQVPCHPWILSAICIWSFSVISSPLTVSICGTTRMMKETHTISLQVPCHPWILSAICIWSFSVISFPLIISICRTTHMMKGTHTISSKFPLLPLNSFCYIIWSHVCPMQVAPSINWKCLLFFFFVISFPPAISICIAQRISNT